MVTGAKSSWVDQLRDVVDHVLRLVDAVRHPFAVAMAAMVERDDVPVVAQRLGRPVPAAAMVLAAMDQEKRRRSGIAPVDVMQPQPLRDEALRHGAEHGHPRLMLQRGGGGKAGVNHDREAGANRSGARCAHGAFSMASPFVR